MESATLSRPRPVPTLRAPSVEAVAFALLCAGALAGFLLYPTWPNYDSAYSLLWGRELLDGRLPGFDAYRAPTQHPLAVAVGTLLAPLGEGLAPRAFVLLGVGGFCALVAGIYRLGQESFSTAVGAVAALLVLTRLDYAFLAARGYVDIPYLALVVWAGVLEAHRPRASAAPWVLLTLAGLLRPEGWVLLGFYGLWRAWPGRRVVALLPAAIAPALWVLTDLVVTGDPLFSFHYTSDLAAELNRTRTASEAPELFVRYLEKLVKWPVLAAAVLGAALAARYAPRRAATAAALTAAGALTFGAIAVGGLSVIDRYLAVTALGLLVFAAVAIAGFTLVEPGPARRVWTVLAAVAALGGAGFTATHLSFASIDHRLTDRSEQRADLEALLGLPAVQAARGCGVLTVPTHKMVADARWMLGAGEAEVLARSGLPDFGRNTRGVHVFVHGRAMLLNPTYGPFDYSADDPPLAIVPGPNATLVARTPRFAAYADC